MQHAYPVPTQADQENFVLRLYFGADGDALDQIIGRAYQDFSRTVHGAGDYAGAKSDAARLLRHAIESLPGDDSVHTQQGFDGWHQATCEAICRAYAAAGYRQFFIGQAQKWINMALKYVYVFGEMRLPGYLPIYRLCHVPIDNIILASAEFDRLADFKEAWSRIKDYSTYMSFQLGIRNRFQGFAPLAVEFTVWQRTRAM